MLPILGYIIILYFVFMCFTLSQNDKKVELNWHERILWYGFIFSYLPHTHQIWRLIPPSILTDASADPIEHQGINVTEIHIKVNKNLSSQENEFDNIVCMVLLILFRPQCVDQPINPKSFHYK